MYLIYIKIIEVLVGSVCVCVCLWENEAQLEY